MNNGLVNGAEMVAYIGSLLLLEITLQEPLYYVGDFTEKKPAGVGPPNSIVDQAHLTRQAKRSKRSRELFR